MKKLMACTLCVASFQAYAVDAAHPSADRKPTVQSAFAAWAAAKADKPGRQAWAGYVVSELLVNTAGAAGARDDRGHDDDASRRR